MNKLARVKMGRLCELGSWVGRRGCGFARLWLLSRDVCVEASSHRGTLELSGGVKGVAGCRYSGGELEVLRRGSRGVTVGSGR